MFFLAVFALQNMVETPLQKIWVLGILGPPFCGIGATIRIGREMLCLPYAGFLLLLMAPLINYCTLRDSISLSKRLCTKTQLLLGPALRIG